MKCSLLTLSEQADGEIDAARAGELEAHLVGCERCRGGMSWIQNEIERVGALATVRVPDHGVHGFLETLGLLGPSDPLPPRSTPEISSSPHADMAPWMSSAPAGALPWRGDVVRSISVVPSPRRAGLPSDRSAA